MDSKNVVQVLNELKRDTKVRRFTESIDLAVNFKDLNLKDASNRFRLDLQLPHPMGKDVKICVIADGQVALEAERADATVLGPSDLDLLANDPKRIRALAREHAYFVASRPLMLQAVKVFRKLLAPRGKMPDVLDPERDDIGKRIAELTNTIRLQVRQAPVVHAPVGTREMDNEKLVENIGYVLERLKELLDRGEHNIKGAYLKTTMGPSYRIM